MIAWFLLQTEVRVHFISVLGYRLGTSTVCHVHISAQVGDICIHTQSTYCSLSAVSKYTVSVSSSGCFCNWIYVMFFLSFFFGKFYLDVFNFYNLNKYDCLIRGDFHTAQGMKFPGCNKGHSLSQVTPPNMITITLKLQMNWTSTNISFYFQVCNGSNCRFTLHHSSKQVEKSALDGLCFYWKLSCLVEITIRSKKGMVLKSTVCF